MKLAKALKHKNHLTGKMNDLMNKIQRYNSYNAENPPPYNAASVLKEWQDTQKQLISLKKAIADANAGIQHKLVELSELKSAKMQLNFSTTVNRRVYKDAQGVETVQETKASISQLELDTMQSALQEQIIKAQDEIDEYNAITTVNFTV